MQKNCKYNLDHMKNEDFHPLMNANLEILKNQVFLLQEYTNPIHMKRQLGQKIKENELKNNFPDINYVYQLSKTMNGELKLQGKIKSNVAFSGNYEGSLCIGL